MSRRDLGLAAVARLAGVSTATVSNAMNRPHMVAEATRERVMAAIDELDFVPNRAAAALRKGTNRVLGLVIPDIVNPFYAAIVDAVVDAADRERYGVALCVSHEDPAREQRHFAMLAEQRAAGALVVPITADWTRLSHLRMVGTRLIMVDRRVDESEACSVAVDDVRGGELAMAHLLGAGGEGVAIVNGARSIVQCEDRRTGARTAMTAAGLHPDGLLEIEVEEMTVDAGVAAGRRLAAAGTPRRIFATNDQLAIGVIRGLAESGLQVPTDAAVIGYGDLAFGNEEAQRLTTVGQPKHEMGEDAVGKLLAELREGAAHQHTATTFQPHLVIRETTAR